MYALHMYIYVYISMYIYIYIHIYMCVCVLEGRSRRPSACRRKPTTRRKSQGVSTPSPRFDQHSRTRRTCCINLSIYQSNYLSVCLSVCLSIYQSINLTIYLSVCLSIYLSIYLCSYVCEYVYLCVGADNFRGRGGPDPQDRQLLRSSRRRWLRCVSVRVSE